MKFFLDTGSIEEIRQAAATGVLDGITTNPSLVAKEGRNFRELLLEICAIVDGPVSAEVTVPDTEGMVRQGLELREIHPNIVVKVPLFKEGIMAVRKLAPQGVKTNVTLCFSATQALIAAKAGATYVSPFIGRLDDISHVGMDLIRDIRTIFDNYGFSTQILTASVRHPVHVLEAALAGSDVATMPHKVFDALFRHPLTDIGSEKFLADWKKLKA
ncbi:MAG TPA: fructose-6-phosphate aldolase [Candidatus Polarisedimenticolia bacterium]|nr:fructose-6-phosphate aldolase [Candidatus Polarisedimenticolia bacterium]